MAFCIECGTTVTGPAVHRCATPNPWRPRVGEPCQTRDGRKARVICDDYRPNGEPRVIALITCREGYDSASIYRPDGRLNKAGETQLDLIPIPPAPRKQRVWIPVVKWVDDSLATNGSYATWEAAMRATDSGPLVACIAVDLEEGRWDEA